MNTSASEFFRQSGLNNVLALILGRNDIIAGSDGDDSMIGYDGDDRISGGPGNDSLAGSAGRDVIEGQGGADQLFGSEGDDSLVGGDGNDTLYGGPGDDTMVGGRGADRFYPEAGFDILSFAGAAQGVRASLKDDGSGGEASGDFYWFGFEGVVGSRYADRLEGLLAGERIDGGGGADTLSGDHGADTLRGQDGNDTLLGGPGADQLAGGAGTDAASYSDAVGGGVTARLGGGANLGDALGDRFFGIENLIGSRFADRLFGDRAANRIAGGAGDDTLVGGPGADRLEGGAGWDTASYGNAAGGGVTARLGGGANLGEALGDRFFSVENLIGSGFGDRLFGDGAANRIEGGAGDDYLEGAGGNDRLTGGPGRDRFIYRSAAESRSGGIDAILDFVRSQDRIDVSAIDADGDASNGNTAFRFIGTRAFSRSEAELRFAGGMLTGDIDGDARIDFALSLGTLGALSASDLVL